MLNPINDPESPTQNQQHKRPYIHDGKFKDMHGCHMIFHGVNVVYKIPPYIPDLEDFDSQTSLTEEDMDNL